MIRSVYRDQVDLLLEVLPSVLDDSSLALKGGTAINLFIMNMPRLSVDIDLTFTKVTDRLQFQKDIIEVFDGFQKRLKAYTLEIFKTNDGIPKQARISNRQSQIKIDLNLILRGTVFPPSERTLCENATTEFEKSVTVSCVSFEDLYAGKFCAALDRQHPRDLYDIKLFFEKYTFTEQLKKAFLVYLISSNRPIHELVYPNLLDQRDVYQREFVGMVEHPVNYEELESARLTLISTILNNLTTVDKNFLISINNGKPEWELINLAHVQDLPGVKWKLINIQKMDASKRNIDTLELQRKLGI